MTSKRYAQIVGWGKYVPGQVLTNDDLAKMVDTSDDWIRTRTGIVERRIADPRETTSTMSIKAARAALQVADVVPERLDLVIVTTATPDYLFPATACLVQDALGARRAGAFDLLAGCSGFVYGLGVGSQLIISGVYENVLVIGAETLSRIMDWTDRNTCVLFGDGAGALLLQASDAPGGVLSFTLGADGSGGDLLMLPGGGSRHPASAETVAQRLHYARMNGREVFRFATRIMGQAAKEAIQAAGLKIDDVDLFIPHQANIRIIESAAKHLRLPMDKVFVNLEKYGNTSCASIPIAFCEAIEEERIKPGDHLVLVSFGAGLTWAAAVVQWHVPLPAPRLPGWKHLLRHIGYRWVWLVSRLRRTYRKFSSWWGQAVGRIRGNDNG
ncbi:MAG: ketoacyl-ACP synthase III [Chloroflexi bacterium]|nr:ketoacyl-ACP synthase III [Chloroflexota bacterium]